MNLKMIWIKKGKETIFIPYNPKTMVIKKDRIYHKHKFIGKVVDKQ